MQIQAKLSIPPCGEGVGDGATAGVCFIAGEGGGSAGVRQGSALGGNGRVLSLPAIPNLTLHTGGGLQELVLEKEVIYLTFRQNKIT